MQWPCVLGILGTMVVAHASAPGSPAKKTAKAAGTSKAGKKSATASSAKGKRARGTRATRRAPGPSYQLHPDSERYAEIQRALADRGYFKGETNGEWKDDSVDALKHFQADQKLPDDGKISALTLTGLGLGPHHDGSTAATVPLPTASASEPPVSESTVGPASSAPPKKDQPSLPAAPAQPPPQERFSVR